MNFHLRVIGSLPMSHGMRHTAEAHKNQIFMIPLSAFNRRLIRSERVRPASHSQLPIIAAEH